MYENGGRTQNQLTVLIFLCSRIYCRKIKSKLHQLIVGKDETECAVNFVTILR